MVGTKKESGLSEVIGFILIIAILVVVASLYVTYVVPAHGREAEIEHMTYIKNQFVDFKMAMDSLWINSQVNTSLSQNIEMGTLGQKTEGQFVFLPLTQPIGSDGEMKLSTSPNDGTIEIQINGLFKETEDDYKDQKISINPDIYRIQNYHRYSSPETIINMIPVHIPSLPDLLNFTPSSMEIPLLTIVPNSTISPAPANWTINLNLKRNPYFSVPEENTTDFNRTGSPYYMKANYGYDLIMNLVKRNQTLQYPVMQNFTIKSNVQSNSLEWINLQDPAYGLDVQGPIIVKNLSDQQFKGTLNITQNYDSVINYTQYLDAIKSTYQLDTLDLDPSSGTPMGKFSYTGKNYYWVPQEFFYQMGGVFLVQNLTEGSVTKVLPLITLGVSENKTPSPSISITKLILDGQNSSISGSTSVQMLSQVSKIRKGITEDTGVKYYIAPTQENARSVMITIGPAGMSSEIAQMWKEAFNSIIYSATVTSPFQANWANVTTDPSGNIVFYLYGPDNSSSWNDITVDYTEVHSNVVLQPVGWQGS